MTFSFGSMLRLAVLLAVGCTILAVGVSRLDPPKVAKRFPRPVVHHNINDFFLRVEDRKPRWIDAETGGMTLSSVVANDVLEAASCSPWVDETGHHQAVGRWSNRTLQGPDTISHEFGLARFSFPDGRILNQISSEMYPVTPPCWFPGTRARVLFPAGDGKLYRYAFETENPTNTPGESIEAVDAEPVPLTWNAAKPEGGNVLICEVAWPQDARMGGRLVASLRIHERDPEGNRRFSRTQIWWLKLNHSGTQIIEAGPLVNHDLTGSLAQQFDERCPSVAALPDGSLGLAYTRQVEGQTEWSVYLTRLTTDADHHLVAALESQTRLVTEGSHPAPLAFSIDGKWLNTLIGDSESDETVVRFPSIVDSTAKAKSPLVASAKTH